VGSNTHSQGSGSTATTNYSEGYAEREQPLLLPHEALQLDAEHVVVFAGGTPPARLGRIDWRERRHAPRPGRPAAASRHGYPGNTPVRVGATLDTARTLCGRGKHTKSGRLMRVALMALVAAAVVLGGGALLNAGRDRDNTLRQNIAAATATTVAVATLQVVAGATRQAEGAALQSQVNAQATQSVATLAAYRANLDATVTAGQVSARATNTAIAQR